MPPSTTFQLLLSALLLAGAQSAVHLGKTNQQAQEQQQQQFPCVGQRPPAAQYGVVVDCGSSGTRATVYVWPRASPAGELAQRIEALQVNGRPASMRIRPGLASVRDNPNYASDYMRPIMEFASQNVPAELQASTPVYFMGTAGMRLLTRAEQQVIMADLVNDLSRDFAFKHLRAEVISGTEEGVFQWVGVNALAGRLADQYDLPAVGSNYASLLTRRRAASQARRLALVEMGGASAQVAFEVSESVSALIRRRLKHWPDAWRAYSDSVVSLELYGGARRPVSVLSVSFLGFGSDTARLLAIDLLARDALRQLPGLVVGGARAPPVLVHPNATLIVQDPCLPFGAEERVSKPLELVYSRSKTLGFTPAAGSQRGAQINVALVGYGNYAKCQHLLNRLAMVARREATSCRLRSSGGGRDTALEPCESALIGTLFVPWTQFEFLGLGELFYTSSQLFNASGLFNGPQFQRSTARLCATAWPAIQSRYGASSDFERRRNLLACFKATWILSWLAIVLRYPLGGGGETVDLVTTSQVRGAEVDWKLGAIIVRSTASEAALYK